MILSGYFNCPDINRNSTTVNQNGQDKEMQSVLIDVTTAAHLTQIHEEPTRENNLLDLLFTSNPTSGKTSTNAPGISDHAMIVTDSDTKSHQQQNPRKKILEWESGLSQPTNRTGKTVTENSKLIP